LVQTEVDATVTEHDPLALEQGLLQLVVTAVPPRRDPALGVDHPVPGDVEVVGQSR
jgi:hypothetical protein